MDYRPKIKLSQDEFRVLASSTRIDILKLLDESQLTVSDVSRRLGMNKATVHEHLTKLMEVGLVSKEESPRKWVYYRLTWKGRNLLHPERVRVMVSLAIVMMVIAIGALLIVYQTPLEVPDDQTSSNGLLTEERDSVYFGWSSEEPARNAVYDIRFESTRPVTMTSVMELRTFIEDNPTSINRTNPVDLEWSRESDTIHLYDYDEELGEHEGQYLYVEGRVVDDQAIERTFNLRKYIVPTDKIDLRIGSMGIVIDTSNMTTSGMVRISFSVENAGSLNVSATPVEVFSVRPNFGAFGFPSYGSPYLEMIYNTTLDLAVNTTENLTFEVPARQLFLRGVVVMLDPINEVPEIPLDNNMATSELPEEVVELNEDLQVPGEGETTERAFGLPSLVLSVGIMVALIVLSLYFLRRY